MLNPQMGPVYSALGFRGGGPYPFVVAGVILVTNTFSLWYSPMTATHTTTLLLMRKLGQALFIVLPLVSIFESRLYWKRISAGEEALERIKGLVRSPTKYKYFTLSQMLGLVVCSSVTWSMKLYENHSVLEYGPGLLLNVTYSAIVLRYSDFAWTVEDLFLHLNIRLRNSLIYSKRNQEAIVSRFCRIHKALVQISMDMNRNFRSQMFCALVLLMLRCMINPSITIDLWMKTPEDSVKFPLYIYASTIAITDIFHIVDMFHPAGLAIQQARNSSKVLRDFFNKGIFNDEEVLFFLQMLKNQQLTFSLFGLVEVNDPTIIRVLAAITTRVFILTSL